MNRSILLALALVLLPGIAAPTRAAGPAAKLNFVLILADDLGWADLGCYGSTFHETPHLDKLAAQGMRFTNGYAACHVCSPTRASILTGKYPARLRITDYIPGIGDKPTQPLLRPKFNQFLPLDEVTLARALKGGGYTSASIGKWHLGGPDYFPEKHGFDIGIGCTDRGSTGSYFFPYLGGKDKKGAFPDGAKDEYLTDRLALEAEKFIEKHQEKPFFLYVPHYAVHTPLQAKKDLIAKYQAKLKPGQEQRNPSYAAMLQSLDESVGRLVKKLDELKLSERTVFIFTSDNGGLNTLLDPPATSNAPLRLGKGFLYEGGTRVPLIVRWPGQIKAGSTCDVPVCSIDFFPTIMELAGVKGDGRQVPDGVSLVPLLTEKGVLKREAIYWHYPHYHSTGGKPSGAVRQGDWKLIEFYEDGKRELYNLKDDIGEKTDLSGKMPAKTKELGGMLSGWRKAVDAQMPTPNPDYKAP